jgi:hypothetical protein
MTNTRVHPASFPRHFVIARCCPEAQADGVPCPILGRSCETCERATRDDEDRERFPAIRPVGSD